MLRLPARPSQLPAARQYADRAAVAFGLDAKGRYQFVYAVNEAVTNAIRHGAPDRYGLIELSIAVDSKGLTFSVRDYGTFVAEIPQPAAGAEHGRGFALMASLVDEVQLSIGAGRTAVRLSKSGPVSDD